MLNKKFMVHLWFMYCILFVSEQVNDLKRENHTSHSHETRCTSLPYHEVKDLSVTYIKAIVLDLHVSFCCINVISQVRLELTVSL
jgi:hypothetical protein